MKCKCPVCGSVFSLGVLMQHDQASTAVMNALLLNGEFGRLAVQYLGLFRPEKTALTMDRLAKLLNELLKEVNSGKIMRNGQEYQAPIECWIDCLEIVLNNRNKIKRPLTSHGYLYEVMTSWKPRNVMTSAVSAVENQQRFSSQTGKALENLAEFASGK